ncbi:MAG: toll/interleukin-1 receptor domain-containing protein [bacterium]
MSDTADIFVSYKRKDKAFVADLVRELEESGFSVWWDTRISAGSEFDTVIETALKSARCVVVVWSDSSIESEWVKNEANEGLRWYRGRGANSNIRPSCNIG